MKNLKGIFICTGQNLTDKTSGISKKISKQVEQMQNVGFQMQIINFDNKRGQNILEKIKFLMPFVLSSYEKRMITFENIDIQWEYIDFVYIRKVTFCNGFKKMLLNIKESNPRIIIFMEIPTYPLNGEYMGIKKILRYTTDYYSKQLKNFVDRIVTYSDDSNIWGIDTIKISNSIDFSDVKAKKPTKLKNINMIAVASFSEWHGYDRVIEGMKEYYKNNMDRKVKLYLVGKGKVLAEYKKLVKDYRLEDVVFFTGAKYGKELDEIYDECNIALDAMGRHRSGVFYNSSLKGKEYGAKGLPIVSGVKTELDSRTNFKYYMRVPADDTPVSISSIIKFYDDIYERDEALVIEDIRCFNKSKFEYTVAFKPVIDEALEKCGK